MNRGRIVLALVGLAAALALVTVGAVATPASAHTTTFTIDPKGTLSPGGLGVTVSGTVACGLAHTGQISVQVVQFRHGQVVAQAFGFTGQFLCTGAAQGWVVTASSSVPFKTGTASVHATSFTFGPDGFESKDAFASVKLS